MSRFQNIKMTKNGRILNVFIDKSKSQLRLLRNPSRAPQNIEHACTFYVAVKSRRSIQKNDGVGANFI
jgi:hypothetical protein